MPSYKMQFKRN